MLKGLLFLVGLVLAFLGVTSLLAGALFGGLLIIPAVAALIGVVS